MVELRQSPRKPLPEPPQLFNARGLWQWLAGALAEGFQGAFRILLNDVDVDVEVELRSSEIDYIQQ